jgi:hypothetical protein
MIRQHQNIWRVYMDLLSNFMGLVTIGGASVMIMVGGAAVQASIGPSPIDATCWSGQIATDQMGIETNKGSNSVIDDLASKEGARRWFRRPSNCEIEIRYPQIHFKSGLEQVDHPSQMPGEPRMSDYDVVEDLCRDAYSAAYFKKVYDQHAEIQFVGRVTSAWDDPNICKEHYRFSWPTQHGYNMRGSAATLKNKCNEILARNRAEKIRDFCSDHLQGSMTFKERPIPPDEFLALTSTSEQISPNPDLCSKHAKDGNCFRTVTLLLRLSPRQ